MFYPHFNLKYQEEIEEMNNVARHRPRSALILGIQQENRQIRELQRENRELRVALEEHQSALDLIMSSYREQVMLTKQKLQYNVNCPTLRNGRDITEASELVPCSLFPHWNSMRFFATVSLSDMNSLQEVRFGTLYRQSSKTSRIL